MKLSDLDTMLRDAWLKGYEARSTTVLGKDGKAVQVSMSPEDETLRQRDVQAVVLKHMQLIDI